MEKIVLAYSGGLDTSIIIPWLREQHPNAGIYGICVNVGQNEDWDAIVKRGIDSGAEKVVVEDAREQFVEDYLFPMLRAGAIYEGKYLLGTAIARPLQAKVQVDYARTLGARMLAHGCTGKGNDQIRFELAYRALAPDLQVIAPWRIWNIASREDAIRYARQKGIPLGAISEKNIYSRDENMWHTSHEGGVLEDLWNRPQEDMFLRSYSPVEAPEQEEEIHLSFEKARPVALNEKAMDFSSLLMELNILGKKHGIGREDIVETRLVGMKSRGVYETPGGSILYNALKELEMITLDRATLLLKNTLALHYAEEIYAGRWFNHFRQSIEAFMKEAMKYVSGEARLVLYKGSVRIIGRRSCNSLYSKDIASFDTGSYDSSHATGYINLLGLSTGVEAMVHKQLPRNDKQKESHEIQLLREMSGFTEK